MEYLDYFKLGSEPFSNAPMSRFYYGSHQHSEALRRLQYVASSMKGLAICVGDIGHGKTTLARRMLDSLPENQYEAAMLVIVHAGITANWLLKRIASQLGVEQPADDKLAILSQLYNRLLEIHSQGKRAVVLIDEAQMLGTRELMEEFRGLLNLEVPEHKLITFIFFGLPDLENNLRLDPPLAQRIALRYHLRPLTVADTTAYIQHRLRVAGATEPLLPPELMPEIHRLTNGVPRLINTLCDNLLLEMYFTRRPHADRAMVAEVGKNLGMPEDPNAPPPVPPPAVDDRPAVEGSEGFDAIAVVDRAALAEAVASSAPPSELLADPDAIAAEVAGEPMPPPPTAREPPVPDPVEAEPSAPEPSAPEPAAPKPAAPLPPPLGARSIHSAPMPDVPAPFQSDEVPAYDGPMHPVAEPAAEPAPQAVAEPDLSDPLSYLSDPPVTVEDIEPSAPREQSLDYLDIEVVEEGSALGLEHPSPADLPEHGQEAPFTPPAPQSVPATPPPSLALPLDDPNGQSEPEDIPAIQAASTLEPSPTTTSRLTSEEVEVSADDIELVEELEAEVEVEVEAEAEEDEGFDTAPTTEIPQLRMGEGSSSDVEVTQVEPSDEDGSSRTVTTSTGSTIDLNEIDNLLADINSSIERK